MPARPDHVRRRGSSHLKRNGELRRGRARRGGRLGQPLAEGYKPNDYSTVNGVYENTTCPQVTQGDAQGTQTLAAARSDA
jgi:hypothetical protein